MIKERLRGRPDVGAAKYMFQIPGQRFDALFDGGGTDKCFGGKSVDGNSHVHQSVCHRGAESRSRWMRADACGAMSNHLFRSIQRAFALGEKRVAEGVILFNLDLIIASTN
jgi:hypothetical protein